MNPERLMTLPCTITHVTQDGTPDEYGNPTEETTTTVLDGRPGCWYEQTKRSEDTDRTNQQSEVWDWFGPPGVDLSGADRVEILGKTYQFNGPPWQAWNPRLRRVTHQQATLGRVV